MGLNLLNESKKLIKYISPIEIVKSPKSTKSKKVETLEEINKKLKAKREFDKEKFEFEEKFYELMFNLGFVNKFNNTFDLKIQSKADYGYYAQIYRNSGLSFAKLKEDLNMLEETLKCIWIMNYEKFSEYANLRIVTKPLDEDICYEDPKIKPHELYLGLDFSLNINKNNNNKNNMFLIAGATGSGKTRFIYMILLSWILNCKINEVELYISDIAKDEYCNLKYVKMVRSYASELEQLYKMLLYLRIKFEKRKKIISQYREEGKATNIEEYNKINKVKMTYVYILIDEASIIMPSKGDKENVKAMKEEILDILCQFSKTCRSYGMFPIIATQKTVKDEIPSLIKDMSAVRISFRANGGKSSESILGDDSAVGLQDRYALYSLDGGCKKDYLFSPKLTTDYLNELLKPHIDKNFKKIDLDAEIKASKQQPQTDSKVVDFPKRKIKVKTKEQPYDVIDTSKIIDDIYKVNESSSYINANFEEDDYVDD